MIQLLGDFCFPNDCFHFCEKSLTLPGIYLLNAIPYENINSTPYPTKKQLIIANQPLSKLLLFHIGGGEGSRTPVRKSIHRSFSECSHCLFSHSPSSPMTKKRVNQPLDR
ncbi:hypothetical protein Awo_c16950 [Acetobacterium woodii DSM 1030]|uniref:Uncharacterized protein n=1 Tax=Acetobacterium woodii (strain ATCC 29683 / DSM 1030 / JCM 2381 / KCTC 1655 / WB1) TaxID=931626 RepID=H6LHU7_ACEWD|nr:hypothetical protein Awo_c16950 [Acetobacterium woodii DSM 1030]